LIKAGFNSSDERLVAMFKKRGPAVVEAGTRAIDISMLLLQKRIHEKLSGEVLNIRTGKLIGSVNKEETTFDGETISGSVTAAAGPARYGKIHEFGGTFTIRRGILSRRAKKNKKRLPTITFPERSFMRSSQEELRQATIERIRRAVTGALR
jgi:phage gpG-like protein